MERIAREMAITSNASAAVMRVTTYSAVLCRYFHYNVQYVMTHYVHAH